MTDIIYDIEKQHLEDFRKSGIIDSAINFLLEESFLESYKDYWKLYYPELLEDKLSEYYIIRLDTPPIDENGKKQDRYKKPVGMPPRIFRSLLVGAEVLLDPKHQLIIVYSEKQALKVAQAGYNCVSFSGIYGYSYFQNNECYLIPDIRRINWENREVLIIPDNDIYYKEHKQKALIDFASKLISEFGATVRMVNLPDYRIIGKKLGADDYLIEYGQEAFNDLNETDITLNNLKTLFIKEDKITFPIEIFKDKTKEFVTVSSWILDAPVEFVACSLIAATSIIISAKANIAIKKDWVEPCILWVMIVAKPGVQIKSPCLKLIKQIIDDFDEELNQKYKESKHNYKKKLLEYNQKLIEWKKSKETGNPPEEPINPERNLIYTSDTTKEALIDLQKLNEGGIAIINDEISSLLRGLNQYKAKGNDEQYFLASWSADRHITTRKTEKEVTTIRPCHNILGTTQPAEVEKLLFTDVKSSNGLIERWLFVLSDYVQSGKLNREDIPQELIGHVEKLLRKLFEMEKTAFTLDKEAKACFDRYFEELATQSKDPTSPELLKSYLLKQRSYVARFTLVLQCLEDVKTTNISKEVVENAIKLSRYFIECFKRISKTSLELKNNSKEMYVLEYMRTKKIKEITPSRLYLTNKSRFRSTNEAMVVLEHLSNQSYGYMDEANNGWKFILYQ